MNTNESFAFHDLFLELRAPVRDALDDMTRRMLALTCKAEVEARPPTHERIRAKKAFSKAAGQGYLSICQWLFDLTRTWRNREDAAPYPYVLYFDKALRHEHFHVAEWANTMALSFKDTCAYKLIVKDCLAGLKWMAAQARYRHKIPKWIDPRVTSLTMVRWFVEEQHVLPFSHALNVLVIGLPESREVMTYFSQLSSVSFMPFEEDDLHRAIYFGRWDAVDFLRERLPEAYDSIAREYPRIDKVVLERPVIPRDKHLDVRTGEVVAFSSRDHVPLEHYIL